LSVVVRNLVERSMSSGLLDGQRVSLLGRFILPKITASAGRVGRKSR
jgi:hypothetical protein